MGAERRQPAILPRQGEVAPKATEGEDKIRLEDRNVLAEMPSAFARG